jgi:ATP-dependent Clp protease ATP-binding subunit ClpC
MYERFTDHARRVIQSANQEAEQHNCLYIGTEHLLLGLVKDGTGVAVIVLRELGVDLSRVRPEVEKLVQDGTDKVEMAELPQVPRLKNVITNAMEESRDLGHEFVSSEHLLLGLLREQECVGAQILMNLGLKRYDEVRPEILRILGKTD